MKIEKIDKLRMFLALSSYEPSNEKQDICPAEKDFIKLINRQLGSKKRQSILNHIDNCPTCYEKLLQLPQTEVSRKKAISISESFIQNILTIIEWVYNSFFNPRYKLVPVLAVATCCIILIINNKLFKDDPLQLSIHNSYKLVIAQSVSHEKIVFPWEYHQKRLILPVQISNVKKAFITGLVDGRKNFSPSLDNFSDDFMNEWKKIDDAKSKDWQIFYNAGKWIFLIQSLKNLDTALPEIFWEDQLNAIDLLLTHMKKYNDTDTKPFTSFLNQIKLYIANRNNEKPIIEQKRIAQKISFFVERFCPKHIPE